MLDLGRLDRSLGLRRIVSLGREISPLNDARALAELVRIARSFRPHIVHTHLAKAGTLGRLAARVVGARAVVHTYHGTVFRGYFSPAKSRLFVQIERALAHLTTRIVAITTRQRRELLALRIGDDRKIVEIPLGLELAPFLVPRERSDARRLLGLPTSVPVVTIVARLVPVKNVSLFLRAMARIPEPALAVIVGDGQERTRLERESSALGISSRCRFLGWQGDMPSVYAAADVVVLTSRNEGSPVSIMEAMASGRPVVATAVGGVPDVVRPGTTGILVPPDDAAALATATRSLLLDPLIRERFGVAARLEAYPRYDVSRLLTDISGLYESLVWRR